MCLFDQSIRSNDSGYLTKFGFVSIVNSLFCSLQNNKMNCYRVKAPYKPNDARLLSPFPLVTGGGLYKPNSSHA